LIKKSNLLWLIAFTLTVFTAIYQRVTGPTYPVSGVVTIDSEIIECKLDRTHGGQGDHQIEIKVDDEIICGELYWKRYKTNDDWTSIEMIRKDGKLIASLPHQPPAGKLVYHITLQKNDEVTTIPEEGEVIIRYKGDVPIYFLIPHIIFIFGAMLLSARTGLEYFNNGIKFKPLTILTFIFLIFGGFILGPIIQYYAFGAFWTGFPFGYDLTDNKVLIGFIGWLLALIALYKFKNPKRWIISASILMFIIFLIPHSVLGSELDYNELDNKTSIENQIAE
ncbi:MAG TPA: hypothetical protein VIY47_14790, partial [Ignavibacteriaceae bacterium]